MFGLVLRMYTPYKTYKRATCSFKNEASRVRVRFGFEHAKTHIRDAKLKKYGTKRV